jgi:hypothetical protein
VVDGDGNGEINIAELTSIGANFNRHVEGYKVYAGQATDVPAGNAAPSTISALDTIPFASASGSATADRLQFSYLVAAPNPALVYWVRPFDASSEGTPSNTVVVSANNPPVINSLGANPGTVDIPAGSSQVTVTATDPDADPLNYSWSADAGLITGTGSTVTWTPDGLSADTTVTVSVTVSDGHGGSDSDSITINAQVAEHLDTIALDPGELLSGSGTQADPYIVPFDNLEIDLSAVSSLSNDWTTLVTWQEDSTEPGTAFSQTTANRLIVSPFDSAFSVTALKDAVSSSNTLYFQVAAPN